MVVLIFSTGVDLFNALTGWAQQREAIPPCQLPQFQGDESQPRSTGLLDSRLPIKA
jgi:hypothetical protein